MKRIFFEAVHNLIAHPLLTITNIIDWIIAIAVMIPVIILHFILNPNGGISKMKVAMDVLFGGDWTSQFAESFHDWTAKQFLHQ